MGKIKLRGFILDDPEWLYKVEHQWKQYDKRAMSYTTEFLYFSAAAEYASKPKNTLRKVEEKFGVSISALSRFIHSERLKEISSELQKKCEEKMDRNLHKKEYIRRGKDGRFLSK